MLDSDENIIARIEHGDESVLNELYDQRYYRPIAKYVRSNSGSEQDAEDIFQYSVVVFWQNVVENKFRQISLISTYLYEVSKRRWLKELRKRKNLHIVLIPDDLEIVDANEYTQEDEREFSDRQEVVMSCMLKLESR